MPVVPENLMTRLHEANVQFQNACRQTDGVADMDTAQRRAMAAALRAAEKELEAATRDIDEFFAQAEKKSE